MSKQPEALRLADWCDEHSSGIYRPSGDAADELRRQHALLGEMAGALREYLDAGHACTDPQGDDVANMIRFAEAEQDARAVLAKWEASK